MIDYIEYAVCYPNGWCLRIGKRQPPKRVLFFKVYALDWHEQKYVGGLKYIDRDLRGDINYYVYGTAPAAILRSAYWLRDKVYWRTLNFLARQGFFVTKPEERIQWKDFMVLPRV